MKGKRKKILVLVVAYNAEETIAKLLDRFDKKTIDYVDEILIADDASKDSTVKVAGWYKEAKKIGKIKVVHHEHNKGYGGNQKWGYDYAIKIHNREKYND